MFWVGARDAPRSRARRRDRRADARGTERPRRSHRRARAHAPARQPRAGHRRGARALGLARRGLPQLHLLVTSRELLRVQGEVEYPVPPLAEPEAVDAVLCARRSSSRSDDDRRSSAAGWTTCPLAVELAAARTTRAHAGADPRAALRSPRPAQGRPRRRRPTADAARDDRVVATSCSRQRSRGSSRGSSVFAGGCTLEAAEEVADADVDTLQSLVEKSLVRHTDEPLLDAGDDPRVRRRAAR